MRSFFSGSYRCKVLSLIITLLFVFNSSSWATPTCRDTLRAQATEHYTKKMLTVKLLEKLLQKLRPGYHRGVDNARYELTDDNRLIIKWWPEPGIWAEFIYSLDENDQLQVKENSLKVPREGKGTIKENTIELFLQERAKQSKQKIEPGEKSSSAGLVDYADFSIIDDIFSAGFNDETASQLKNLMDGLKKLTHIPEKHEYILNAVEKRGFNVGDKGFHLTSVISAVGTFGFERDIKTLSLLLIKEKNSYYILAVDLVGKPAYYRINNISDPPGFNVEVYNPHIRHLGEINMRWLLAMKRYYVTAVRMAGQAPSILVYTARQYYYSLFEAGLEPELRMLLTVFLGAFSKVGTLESNHIEAFKKLNFDLLDIDSMKFAGFRKADWAALSHQRVYSIKTKAGDELALLPDSPIQGLIQVDEALALCDAKAGLVAKSSSAGVSVDVFAQLADIGLYNAAGNRALIAGQFTLLHNKIVEEKGDLSKIIRSKYTIEPMGVLKSQISLIGPFSYAAYAQVALMITEFSDRPARLLAISNSARFSLYEVSVKNVSILEGIIAQAIDSGSLSSEAASAWRNYLKQHADKPRTVEIRIGSKATPVLAGSNFYFEMMRQNQDKLLEGLVKLASRVLHKGGISVTKIKDFIRTEKLEELNGETFKNMGQYGKGRDESSIYRIEAKETGQIFIISRQTPIKDVVPIMRFDQTSAKQRICVVNTYTKSSSSGKSSGRDKMPMLFNYEIKTLDTVGLDQRLTILIEAVEDDEDFMLSNAKLYQDILFSLRDIRDSLSIVLKNVEDGKLQTNYLLFALSGYLKDISHTIFTKAPDYKYKTLKIIRGFHGLLQKLTVPDELTAKIKEFAKISDKKEAERYEEFSELLEKLYGVDFNQVMSCIYVMTQTDFLWVVCNNNLKLHIKHAVTRSHQRKDSSSISKAVKVGLHIVREKRSLRNAGAQNWSRLIHYFAVKAAEEQWKQKKVDSYRKSAVIGSITTVDKSKVLKAIASAA